MRARPQRQAEPQRRGRGFGLGLERAQGKQQTRMLGRTGMQAAQLFRPGLGQPAEHRAHAARFERLFGGPQALGLGVGVDPDQALLGQACAGQARQVRMLRRPDQQHAAALLHQLGQGRAQQAPLALAPGALQHLGERLTGPAPARQLGIQPGVAAGDALLAAFAQGMTRPDRLGQVRGQGRQGGSGYCMHAQYRSRLQPACLVG